VLLRWERERKENLKQIDKLVEFMFMVGEVSPDVLGMGKGQSDSGRALKFKLMRTIAKVNRKKLYYDPNIKEIALVAEMLSKKHNAPVGGKVFKGEPKQPELKWQDGLPSDEVETATVLTQEMDAGITSQIQGIMEAHQVDKETAEIIAKQINEENKASMPAPLDPKRNPFANKEDDDEPPKK